MDGSPSAPVVSSRSLRDGYRNGALAALFVLFLDLLWRVVAAPPGAPSIPETVVAAVARLTPTAIFGWATENLGSLAQNTLFAVVLIGIVAAGAWAGNIAALGVKSTRFGAGWSGRLIPAAVLALILFLVITAGVFPVAREGMFAAGGPPGSATGASGALCRWLGGCLGGADRQLDGGEGAANTRCRCSGGRFAPLGVARCRRGRVDGRGRVPRLALGESSRRR